MQAVYVSQLFQLLDLIGTDWKTVGKALDAPRTPLSLWRHGRRPIAKAYAAPFIRYTIAAVDRALAEAKARDVTTQGRSILSTTSTYQRLLGEMWQCIDAWEHELVKTTTAIDQEYQRWFNVLAECSHLDLSKHEPFDVSRIGYAAKRIGQCVDELHRQRGDTYRLVIRHGFVPGPRVHDPTESPAERIAELARWAGISVDASAEMGRKP
jgi:hypothetical protein